MTVSNYESRLERLEQEVAAPIEPGAIAYLYDSDTRPADRLEVQGQRFDRGADEDKDSFRQRASESLGMAHRNLIVVHYVASDGSGRPRFQDAA
jgi:hypothetical protein